MKHAKTTAAPAGIVAATSVAAGALGAGHADARDYTRHGVTLTVSQTAFVAHNNLGTAFSGIPYIPNLVYNPTWGHVIQRDAQAATLVEGCIEIGIATPNDGGPGNIDYVTLWPASRCAP
ncbi:hypothetical protein QNM97_25365 [Gordonia sp. L191]|uniref:hypothetical protein n=1 Tax=Gordonia sp. L191 TaxID=2982699 RepID=UPI0024BF4F85|nr:hypothetical protein [Gordonia sp. L191]WHU46569.1 hypothetical protein QNM97_21720 [Gordonia sp. L191]WHU47230.1 hypothetical protein QNM97_25365 [Gordonia sp. L191]